MNDNIMVIISKLFGFIFIAIVAYVIAFNLVPDCSEVERLILFYASGACIYSGANWLAKGN